MNIPAYIKAVRLKAELSQAAFGTALQTSRSKIANYETGRTRTTADFFLAVQGFELSLQHTKKSKPNTILNRLTQYFTRGKPHPKTE